MSENVAITAAAPERIGLSGGVVEVTVGEPAASERPQRWDKPFASDMTSQEVDRLMLLPYFVAIDASRFPRHLSLRDILLNDSRVLRMTKGQLVVREGEYGRNSAFLVLRGKARVFLEHLEPTDYAHGTLEKPRSLLRTIARALRRDPPREERVHHTQRSFGQEERPGMFLQDVPRVLDEHRSAEMLPGEIFGELAALGRTQRTATVIAAEDGTEFLELRWQGLREIMNFAPAFTQRIEASFRENGLRSLLRGMDIIRRLPESAVSEIVEQAKFERHGSFDWYGSYEQMRTTRNAAARLEGEPLIVREGDFLNGLIVVRGGFVRVSTAYNKSERTVSYLGKGQHYGLGEIWQHHLTPGAIPSAQHSLRAVGYVDLVLIPLGLVERLIIPSLTESELAALAPPPPRVMAAVPAVPTHRKISTELLEFFMDKRTINGRAAMLIDLDRCTRCDDCVRACSSTHDGNPRFIRHGEQREGIQVVQACMHCLDPICMIPCPTGAIQRQDGGEVVINDATCIGCSRCANNCPYDNIQMVEIRDHNGSLQYPVRLNPQGGIELDPKGKVIPLRAEGPIRRATKCDLCHEHHGGPACVRACPHDAMVRMDMQDTEGLAAWLSR